MESLRSYRFHMSFHTQYGSHNVIECLSILLKRKPWIQMYLLREILAYIDNAQWIAITNELSSSYSFLLILSIRLRSNKCQIIFVNYWLDLDIGTDFLNQDKTDRWSCLKSARQPGSNMKHQSITLNMLTHSLVVWLMIYTLATFEV